MNWLVCPPAPLWKTPAAFVFGMGSTILNSAWNRAWPMRS